MKISRKVSFILFFSFSFSALGQKNICGRILDSLSLKPVSYATVSTLSTSMYCDSLGYFKLNNSQDDYLIVSCVGYNTKRVNIDYDKCDTILLSPAFKELNPVTVRKPDFLKNNRIQIGRLEGKSKFSIIVASGLTILKYFPIPEQSKTYIIGELKLRVNHSPDDYEPRKVRVRIFEANAGYVLGRDILQLSDIFIIDNIKNKIATLDLSSYGIRMPKNGCFIGIEFIRNGFDNELKSKEYQGWLVIKGWLANSFEDGVVLRSYFNNEFTELLWGSSKKSNIYAALTLFEDAEN
jgi:hypothetical protein